MSTWCCCGSGSYQTTVSAQQAGDSPILVHLDEPNTDLATPPTAPKSPKKHCTRNSRISKTSFTRYNRLSNRLNNRLRCVSKHQPVVQQVVQPVWQPVVSCKRGITVAEFETKMTSSRYCSFHLFLILASLVRIAVTAIGVYQPTVHSSLMLGAFCLR